MSIPPDDDSTTLPSISHLVRSAPQGACPQLFVLLEEERAPERPRVIGLEDHPVLELVRGRARPPGAAAVSTISLADRWMSTTHARISRVGAQFVLEDLESKNGTAVDGVEVEKHVLTDGNMVEVGHSLLLFRNALPMSSLPAASAKPGFATLSAAYARQLAEVTSIAKSRVPVLVQGETGTGKELIARGVHALSGASGAFVAVNCGGLPATLLEAELFGYRRGAFSGALRDHPGLVRAAQGGTLFLDEIGDLPAAGQAAVLRALQESEVLPVGEVKPVKVDFRLVAATHYDLAALVAAGRFRKDLLGRLGGHLVELPPLRARREDLAFLIGTLLARHAGGRADAGRMSTAAARALYAHGWPLNVRELERCLEAALALAGDGVIGVDQLPAAIRGAIRSVVPEPPASRPLGPEDEQRKLELAALLATHAGNITAVAKAMGKARVQIRRWMKRYGL